MESPLGFKPPPLVIISAMLMAAIQSAADEIGIKLQAKEFAKVIGLLHDELYRCLRELEEEQKARSN